MSDPRRLAIVVLGLTITSTWGNGHATTYRALLRALAWRGHEVLFLERDRPWYAAHRDLAQPPFCRTLLYDSVKQLETMFARSVRDADLVIVGSYVPEGVAVGRFVVGAARGITAFYDIDTPVTLAKLARGDDEYLAADLIPAFDLYLSFTGGPTLADIERRYGARMARPLYCAVDPGFYFLEPGEASVDLGYLGTYAADRQPKLERLLLEPARRWPEGRFAVAGPQYPTTIAWPGNVTPIEYLPAQAHRAFYGSQRFTLNLTRADMVAAGFSPSVRLFEAAACGTPIISDAWPGLATLFEPGREILARNLGRRRAAPSARASRGAPAGDRGGRAVEGARRAYRSASGAGARGAGRRSRGLAPRPCDLPERGSRRAAGVMTSPAIERDIARLGPWFHNLHLPDGQQTAPQHPLGDFPSYKWAEVAPWLPEDLTGWTAVDVGCNAGFYSFELARRGAEVTAVDFDPRYLCQARWAASAFGLETCIRFQRRQVYALADVAERYDLVLFMGVFYHLRYPLLGLDIVARMARRLLVFQSLTSADQGVAQTAQDMGLGDRARLDQPGWPRLAFIEDRLCGDPTNWWIPNHAAMLALLRSAGLRVIGRPGHEIYLCVPAPARGGRAAIEELEIAATAAARQGR
jgi:methyltransferase (TIGR04290 family)